MAGFSDAAHEIWRDLPLRSFAYEINAQPVR
jgi:hypothetical protein